MVRKYNEGHSQERGTLAKKSFLNAIKKRGTSALSLVDLALAALNPPDLAVRGDAVDDLCSWGDTDDDVAGNLGWVRCALHAHIHPVETVERPSVLLGDGAEREARACGLAVKATARRSVVTVEEAVVFPAATTNVVTGGVVFLLWLVVRPRGGGHAVLEVGVLKLATASSDICGPWLDHLLVCVFVFFSEVHKKDKIIEYGAHKNRRHSLKHSSYSAG